MDAFVIIDTQPNVMTPETSKEQPPKKSKSSWEYYKRNPDKLKEHYKNITNYVKERYSKDEEFKERQKERSRLYYLNNAEYRLNKINKGKEAYRQKKLQSCE